MMELIKYFNNILFDTGREYLVTILDPRDHLFEVIKEFKPQIESWSVFTKTFDGLAKEASSYYVDIRDMIP
jgi:hypothetical protein